MGFRAESWAEAVSFPFAGEHGAAVSRTLADLRGPPRRAAPWTLLPNATQYESYEPCALDMKHILFLTMTERFECLMI